MNQNLPTIINGTAGDDTVEGTIGIDLLLGFGGNDLLQGNEGHDFLFGHAGNDILYGGEGHDYLLGGTGNDLLYGDEGSDILLGGEGNDRLYGGIGSDLLLGNDGNDVLVGGTGADTFGFLSPNQGIDTIVDFNLAQGDLIQISASGFGGGLTGGTLDADQLTIGSAATNGSDRFIYNDATGALFFDPDGTGALGQIQFAQLSTGLALTNSDIFVV